MGQARICHTSQAYTPVTITWTLPDRRNDAETETAFASEPSCRFTVASGLLPERFWLRKPSQLFFKDPAAVVFARQVLAPLEGYCRKPPNFGPQGLVLDHFSTTSIDQLPIVHQEYGQSAS